MTDIESLHHLKTVSPLRITISGDIGSGKSTFAKHLSEELGIPRTYIGGLMREEAQKRGITLDALNTLLEKDDEVDRRMDSLQKERAQEIERGIFEGRTSWYFVENPDIRLFLRVDPRIAAERIAGDESELRDSYRSVEEIMAANEERKQSEMKRYQGYYGIDVYDERNFDIVIDTSSLTREESFSAAIEKMVDFLEKRGRLAKTLTK